MAQHMPAHMHGQSECDSSAGKRDSHPNLRRPRRHRYNRGVRSTRRLHLAALLNDTGLYLAFSALPFRALELGAGPVALGALPTLYAGTYMCAAALGGRLSDRIPRLSLARAGCALFVVGSLILSQTSTLLGLAATIPLLGIALGCFWSPIQATLSDRVEPAQLPREIGVFNVAWSLGKGTGIVLGGVLAEALAPNLVLIFAGVPVLATFTLLSTDPERRALVALPGPPDAELAGAPERPDVLLRLAWMTNALAYGVVGIFNMHAPAHLLDLGSGPLEFGILFGSVFVVQTLTFVAVAAAHPRPTRGTLLLSLAAAALALTLFLLAPGPLLRLVALLPLGVATGLAYHASLQRSLDRAHGRGRTAGLHETLIGAGSSTLPLLGGALAALTFSLEAPFVLGIAFLLVGFFVATAFRPREDLM